MSYLSTVYSESTRPKTSYPSEFAAHVKELFSIPDGARLLDIGCGRGEFASAFADHGLVVDGMDWEKTENFAHNVTFSEGDASKIFPYADNTFDVVFSKSVIEHLLNPEHFIKEHLRVLKSGGLLLCFTPDWKTTLYVFYDDHTHVKPFTVGGLHDLMLISGVDDVSVDVFYQLPVLWRHPWLIIFSKMLQLLGPVKKLYKNKFHRWSRELMVLGSGRKK